jgi:hypothetical protein
MKRLCSVRLDGEELEYLLDLGKRSNSYLCVKDGVVTVRLPLNGTQRSAEQLILSHKDWLCQKLRQSQEKSRLPQNFAQGESFSLLGKRRRLCVAESPSYRAPELTDDTLTVYVSPTMTDEDLKRLFLRYVSEICERCVKAAFERYSPILGLAPRKVTIKKMTSRWGSCSSNGNIAINSDVVCFEQACIDYVVIHELCHLKHMNHGEDFWRLVSTCCPDYKAMRERMKH